MDLCPAGSIGDGDRTVIAGGKVNFRSSRRWTEQHRSSLATKSGPRLVAFQEYRIESPVQTGTSAADHSIAPDCDVNQGYVLLGQSGGYDQIPLDDQVAQGDTGTLDHYIAFYGLRPVFRSIGAGGVVNCGPFFHGLV